MDDATRCEIEAAVELIEGGHMTELSDMLPEALASPPRVVLNPVYELLVDETVISVYGQWRTLDAEGRPLASDFNLIDFSDAARYLMLLDIEEAGWSYRYRYYGAGIAERAGFDLTGKSTWEVPTSPEIALFFNACYRLAWVAQQPLHSQHVAPPAVTVASWTRLILPLFDADRKEVIRFLVANIPGPWRRPE